MFHLAYLAGSLIATHVVLGGDRELYDPSPADVADPAWVLRCLRIAHCLVPVFNLLSLICDEKGWHAAEKTFDTISIYQYITACLYA